ncbi:hypothetical protein BpHYR1_023637 [Brachionus plicatilis]|uniref:Uncharacterized protein n=1 Tax=Brachionus plicatilis TaxID=10195 RepID=A0A3M7RUM4_BRAPC|nr:hypothetical protein BpHYR1_023637 [Brachionus plicatilis]
MRIEFLGPINNEYIKTRCLCKRNLINFRNDIFCLRGMIFRGSFCLPNFTAEYSYIGYKIRIEIMQLELELPN